MKLFLEIITPTKVLLKEEVDEITIPTVDGEISILPGHVNLLTKIRPGEMLIRTNNKKNIYAIFGGFLDISKNKVSVLADHAIMAEDIEMAKVKEAEERARLAMQNKTNEEEFRVAQLELNKAILELKVARKHKAHRS